MIIGVSGKIGSGKDTVGTIVQDITATRTGFNLVKHYNWQRRKFADKLKQITSILTGIPVEDLEKQEVKDSILGSEWGRVINTAGINLDVINWKLQEDEYFGKTDENNVTKIFKHIPPPTVRELLQKLGTEAMRDVIHPNIWVNALFADYKEGFAGDIMKPETYNDFKLPNWVITDVRFPNEAEAIIKHGGVVLRVSRGKVPPCIGHSQHPSETALDNYDGFYAKIDNNGSIEELTHKIQEVLQKLNLIN